MKEQLREYSQRDVRKSTAAAVTAGSSMLAKQCREAAVTVRVVTLTFTETNSRAAQH